MSSEQLAAIEEALRKSYAREIEQEKRIRGLEIDLEISRAETANALAQLPKPAKRSPELADWLKTLTHALGFTMEALTMVERHLRSEFDEPLAERFLKLHVLLARAQVAAEKKLSDGE